MLSYLGRACELQLGNKSGPEHPALAGRSATGSLAPFRGETNPEVCAVDNGEVFLRKVIKRPGASPTTEVIVQSWRRILPPINP